MANRNDKFFQRLTRIFSSGPSVMRRVKGFDYRSYYDNDLIRGNYGYRAPFPFGRENSPFSTLGAYGILDRTARYSEFAEMETEPIIAAALNVWADEVAAGDEKGKALHLYSRNPEIKKNLEELFFDVLNVDFNLRSWARNLVKYGDFFLYLEVVPDIGVINVQPIPVNELEREEGFDPSDPYSVRFKWLTRGNRYLENWQVLHMRILGNDLLLPYGVSLLEPARRVYRQLCHKKGTKVWVKDIGQVNIENVKPGQIVYSYDAQTNSVKETKVKHSIPMGIQPLVKVRTAHREIIVTPNHGLLVKDHTGTCGYKKACEILVSNGLGGNHSRNADKLVLPIIQSGQDKVEYNIVKERYKVKLRVPLPGNGVGIMRTIRAAETGMSDKYIHSFLKGQKKVSYTVYERLCKHIPNLSSVEVDLYLNHSKAKSIFFTKQNDSVVLDKEFVRFFGFMLGDGWVNKNGFGYAYGVDEKQNQQYDNIVNRLFGVSGYRSRREGTWSAQINYSSQELANMLTDLGFVSGFSKKVIPGWCYGLNAELKRELILGLYDAHGCYSNGTISLTNKKLIEDLKCLAHQAGYPVGRISKVKARNNSCAGREFVSKESYTLWVNTNRPSSDTVFENVIDVTPVPSDETYDLEVDDALHNFTADGVVTHNTMMEDAMLVYRVERCLHGDSKIWTTAGYKKITEIKVGDTVQSFDYEKNKLVLSKVVDWHDNGPKNIWEVKTKHRTIKTSDNHPVLTKDMQTGKIDYVLTRHLVPGRHMLFLPTLQSNKITKVKLKEEKYEWYASLNDQGKMAFRKFSSENKGEVSGLIKEIAAKASYKADRIKGFLYARPGKVKTLPKEVAEVVCNYLSLDCDTNLTYAPKGMYNLDGLGVPEVVDEDFARFFGFMLGDGSVSKCKHKICFAAGANPDINEKYRSLLQKYCGKVGFNQDKRRKDSCRGILGAYQAHSYYFANLMEDMGYIPGAHNKRIPAWVFESSNEIKAAFIEGIIDADGHVRTQRNTESYEIELCNENLINDLKELCHQLGWNVSANAYKRTKKQRTIASTGKTTKETTGYSIHFTKQKTPGLEKVVSVKETREVSNVYDIRVDNDLHNFVADGVVVHNSPERRVFYIDVANIPPNDVPSFLEATKATLRSRDVVDKNTGRIDRRHNPLNMLEDFYIPVRGSQSGTKIETLAGATNATATEDVEYLQKKLFSAIQVPKAYLNYVENMGAKASLSQLDVRFSRTISVLQRIVLAELNKLAMIHLYSKGFDGEDLINFELKLSNPSTVALQQKLEVLSTKIDIAGKAKESGLVDQEWIQKRILELTQEEVARIEIGKRKDRIRDVELEAVAVAENLPDPNSKVDAFDSSNYDIPGQSVAKNSAVEPIDSNSDFDHIAPILAAQKQTFKNSDTIGKQKLGNDVESDNNYRVKDTSGNYLPISASPFTYNSRRKNDRRVGAGGRDNISMPDFKSMLSGTDKYTKDVVGSTDLNLKRSLFESMNIDDDAALDSEDQILERIFATPNRLPGEMKNIFSNIDRKFGKRSGRSESLLLIEDSNSSASSLDIDLEIVDAEPSLLEPANILSEIQQGSNTETIVESTEDFDLKSRATTLKDLLEDTDET